MAATTTTAASLSTLSPSTGRRFVFPSTSLSFSYHRLTTTPTALRAASRTTTTTAGRRRAPSRIAATIAVGDKLPNATLSYFDPSDGELKTVTVSDLTAGKKAVLFAVPGAFTPTCSQKHLPGFATKAAELRAKGVDTLACVSVKDAFVMKAWKEALGVGDDVMMMVSDGNLELTRALGVEMDLSDKPVGLGVRSRRYCRTDMSSDTATRDPSPWKSSVDAGAAAPPPNSSSSRGRRRESCC